LGCFSAVDEADEPNELIEFLDMSKVAPGMLDAKAELLDQLEPERARSALDIGLESKDEIRRLMAGYVHPRDVTSHPLAH
jgi:hypothetical protein